MANSEPPRATLSERADDAWQRYCKNTTGEYSSDHKNRFARELFKSGFYAAIALIHQDTATEGRLDEQQKKRDSNAPAGGIPDGGHSSESPDEKRAALSDLDSGG